MILTLVPVFTTMRSCWAGELVASSISSVFFVAAAGVEFHCDKTGNGDVSDVHGFDPGAGGGEAAKEIDEDVGIKKDP